MEYKLIQSKYSNYDLTPTERILTNRGIDLEDVPHYIHTTDADVLPPTLISNIEWGARLLIQSISEKRKILVIVDSDCDGYTSSAVLINYLHKIFPWYVENYLVYQLHTGKEHGIILETIPDDIGLVICPDSSSNDYEQHEALAARGVYTLVIDHHEAEQISQYACVINNQLCDYPTKSLSGVGMVYKFCQYLDLLLEQNYADDFLDLVSLGITADVMDLRDFETRHLVSKGLQNIKNPFFSFMVEKQAFVLGNDITSFGIAFYIAPLVNATVRVGTQHEKLVLFESMLDYKAYQEIPSTKRGCSGQTEMRVSQACRNCTNIKNRQTKARDASLDVIGQMIEKDNLLKNKILIIKFSASQAVDKNLTGLIANQLMGQYARPVLILNENVQDKTWEGSARNYDKSEFKDFKDFIDESGLALYAAGHQGAFGVGFTDENLAAFITYSNEKLKDFDFSSSYQVDYIWNANNYNPQDILDIASLKYLWGQGVKEATIAIENITVTKNNLKLGSPDKNPTIIINLPNGTSLVKFRSNAQEYETLYSELGCVKINIVGKCAENVWNGNISPQIIIDDYSIIDRQAYYF